jgi:hypothetical protein
VTTLATIISSYFVIALAKEVFVLEDDNGHAPLKTKVQQQPKPIVEDQEI